MIDSDKTLNSLNQRRRLLGTSSPLMDLVKNVLDRPLSSSAVLSAWQKYAANKPIGQPIDFYVHTPYCLTRCSYCLLRSRTAKKCEIGSYADKLIHFLEPYVDIHKNTVFRNLYFGGGTPSIIPDKDFDKLISFILSNFQFEKDGGRCIEMNPISATDSKIAIMKKYHFNRLSLGVQSLDPEVLKINKRGYQTEEMVKHIVQTARQEGFPYYDTDILIGLAGDTKEKLLETFRKIIDIRPQSICVFQVQAGNDYLRDHFHGSIDEYDQHFNDLYYGCIDKINAMAKNAGYLVPNFSNFYTKGLFSHSWAYNLPTKKFKMYIGDEPNVSVFGVGECASAKIYDVIGYTNDTLGWNPKETKFTGRKLDHHIDMIDYITKTLSQEKSVSLSLFQNIFKTDLTEEFIKELHQLAQLNAIEFKNNHLYLLPEDRTTRFLLLTYFFKPKDVQYYFAHHIGSSAHKNNPSISQASLKSTIKKIKAQLNIPAKKTQFDTLIQKIEMLSHDHQMIDGTLEKITSSYLTFTDKQGKRKRVVLSPGCLFTTEYSLNKQKIYEEKVSAKKILIPSTSLTFFVDSNQQVSLIRRPTPLDR